MSSPVTAEDWDQLFSHPNHVYGYRPNEFLKGQSRLFRPGSRILCVCDGEGRNGVWLAEQGHDVVSLDFSAVALEKARRLAAERGVSVETWQVDLAEWVHHPDPERPWDAVVVIFAHLPSALRRAVAATVTRQASPGAVLVLEAFTPAQPALGSGGPTDPDLLVTRADVTGEWVGWRPDVRLIERRLFEGMAHQGLASVVQVLALRA